MYHVVALVDDGQSPLGGHRDEGLVHQHRVLVQSHVSIRRCPIHIHKQRLPWNMEPISIKNYHHYLYYVLFFEHKIEIVKDSANFWTKKSENGKKLELQEIQVVNLSTRSSKIKTGKEWREMGVEPLPPSHREVPERNAIFRQHE